MPHDRDEQNANVIVSYMMAAIRINARAFEASTRF